MKETNHTLVGIVFVGMLAAGTLCSLFWPRRTFSQQENRILAQCPKLSWESASSGVFGQEYEAYLSDQFFLRDQWLKLEVVSERLVGKQDVNGVYFGKDDYLIERHSAKDILEEQVKKNIEAVTTFLSRHPGRFLAVPSASCVLSEKAPAFGPASEFSQEQVLKGLEEAFEAAGRPEAFLNGKEILQEHREEEIYYRTDHHWTTLGAYYGYCAWAESRGSLPVTWTEDNIRTVSTNFYGTVFSKVGLGGRADSIKVYLPEGSVQVDYNEGQKITDSYYELSFLDQKDQYSLFFDGNQPIVRIRTEKQNGKRLLVVKDSFAHCMVPFLAEEFEEVIMVDPRHYFGSLEELYEREQVTEVLFLYNLINFSKDRYLSVVLR